MAEGDHQTQRAVPEHLNFKQTALSGTYTLIIQENHGKGPEKGQLYRAFRGFRQALHGRPLQSEARLHGQRCPGRCSRSQHEVARAHLGEFGLHCNADCFESFSYLLKL